MRVNRTRVTRQKSLPEHCDYGEEEDNQVRDIVTSHVTSKELKVKFYREENLSLSKLLEIVSTYHNKDVMVLVSEDAVNRTWEDRDKGDKQSNNKPQWQGKCWRCAKPGHMANDCEASVNILAASVEFVGTWRSVVTRKRINK